jgi:hypothetical protein
VFLTYNTRIRCTNIVMQEKGSMFWEVIVSVVVRKQVHMNTCAIVNVQRNRAV